MNLRDKGYDTIPACCGHQWFWVTVTSPTWEFFVPLFYEQLFSTLRIHDLFLFLPKAFLVGESWSYFSIGRFKLRELLRYWPSEAERTFPFDPYWKGNTFKFF